MVETLKVAVTGANVFPTILFGLVIIYWLTMIIGVLDLDFLDFDLDADADVDVDVDVDPGLDAAPDAGIFHSVLIFLNLDSIPFMIVMSILVFTFWTLAMVINILPFQNGGLIALALFVPAFFVSMMFTAFVTKPMKKLFTKVKGDMDRGADVEGQLCVLKTDLAEGRMGQAQFVSNGKHIVINVKAKEGLSFEQGEKALVLERAAGSSAYTIDKFNDWE